MNHNSDSEGTTIKADYLFELLTREGLNAGKDAFIELCHRGCDSHILAESFIFLCSESPVKTSFTAEQRLANMQQLYERGLISKPRPAITEFETRRGTVESEVENLKGSIVALDAKFNGQLDGRLDSINTHIDGLRADVDKSFRSLDRQMDRLSGGITRLHADHSDLEERVGDLERKAS